MYASGSSGAIKFLAKNGDFFDYKESLFTARITRVCHWQLLNEFILNNPHHYSLVGNNIIIETSS